MAIKVMYDSMDEVPSEAAFLFTEKDGKAVLTGVEGIKTQVDVDNVKKVADKERKLRAETELKLKRFEALGDHDPAELLKLKDEVEELRVRGAGGKDDAAVQKLIDAAIARATGPLNRDLASAKAERDAATAKAAERDKAIRETTVRTELQAAMDAAKVAVESRPDVMMYQAYFEVADDGKVVTRDGLTVAAGLSPDLFLAEMRDKGRPWFGVSVGGGLRGGDGAGKNGGPNPFKAPTFNFTQASMILKNDPARAKALSSGFASPLAAITARGVLPK